MPTDVCLAQVAEQFKKLQDTSLVLLDTIDHEQSLVQALERLDHQPTKWINQQVIGQFDSRPTVGRPNHIK